jgi:AcrR family transcriptional regulator
MERTMSDERRYHHGDLRAALLEAAEAELAEKGVEGFTLRGCARRAGVSHAAPAHHFADVTAMLTAVATVAFDRLTEAMRDVSRGLEPGSLAYLEAIGRGYVLFASRNPEHFKLMFRRERLNGADAALQKAGAAAFGILVHAVGAFRGVMHPMDELAATRDVFAAWSLVHGFAGLILAGQVKHAGSPEDAIDALVPAMVWKLFS